MMGNQGNLQGCKAVNRCFFFPLLRPDFTCGDEICTISGETSCLGLLAFLSRSRDCCGGRSFLWLKPNNLIKSQT